MGFQKQEQSLEVNTGFKYHVVEMLYFKMSNKVVYNLFLAMRRFENQLTLINSNTHQTTQSD